jgi:hypothetical protein
MSNTSIQLKKSGISGNTPSNLIHGEVALNYADGKLYYKDVLDSTSYITNQDSFSTVSVNGTLILASSPTDILSIVPGNNVTLAANTSSKRITINSVTDPSAGNYANAAFIHANAAYDKANTGTTALDVNSEIIAFTIAFS